MVLVVLDLLVVVVVVAAAVLMIPHQLEHILVEVEVAHIHMDN